VARIVYTSGPEGTRSQKPQASVPPEKQPVHVRVERAGRGGKTVTVAGPFLLARADAALLLAELKRACGGGGALRESTTPAGEPALVLELQGDHRARLPELLRARGFHRAR
jgi:translation initiation factor 1